MKAITDSLREEVNPLGVLVLTVYFGPHSHADAGTVCREEGRVYDPEALLQPEDAATVALQALMLPAKAEVTDVAIRPMAKACGPLKVGSMKPRSIMKGTDWVSTAGSRADGQVGKQRRSKSSLVVTS